MTTAEAPFVPLKGAALLALKSGLVQNGYGSGAILTDPVDTSFAGTAEGVSDLEVVNAIKSVPMHY